MNSSVHDVRVNSILNIGMKVNTQSKLRLPLGEEIYYRRCHVLII
jgi:hypothetical protein